MSEYIITDEQIAENRRLHGKKLLVMPVVVRCRDCKWLVETSNPISSTGWWCVTNDTPRGLDGFCDWAIRRDA